MIYFLRSMIVGRCRINDNDGDGIFFYPKRKGGTLIPPEAYAIPTNGNS